jgi:TusA-related sulfurtransferase
MRTFELDNRGLEPPEPMVRILDAVKDLEDGDQVVALMDREPFLLYPELTRRGLEWDLEQDDENFVLTIRRGG